MSQNNIKVVVADTAMVVRMGVVAALKRALGANTACLEVAHPEDFETKVISFAPSVIVVSPTFGGRFDVIAQRIAVEEYAQGVKFVALLSSVLPASMLTEFDAQLSIFDSEDELVGLFAALLGEEAADGDDETLSYREKQVVRGVVSGLANKEIADQMNISVYTVLTHRRNIAKKLNIHSSIALAIYAISNKLVTVDEVKG